MKKTVSIILGVILACGVFSGCRIIVTPKTPPTASAVETVHTESVVPTPEASPATSYEIVTSPSETPTTSAPESTSAPIPEDKELIGYYIIESMNGESIYDLMREQAGHPEWTDEEVEKYLSFAGVNPEDIGHLEIFKDGTARLESVNSTVDGTWTVSGDTYTFTFDSSTSTATIVGNRLTLIEDGQMITFIKGENPG